MRITMAVFVPAAGAVLGAQVFSDLSALVTSHHQLLVTLGAILGSLLAKLFARREVEEHARSCGALPEVRALRISLDNLGARVAALESKEPPCDR